MAKGRGFLEKSIDQVAQALEEAVFSEEISRRPGLLQGLDPRIKVLAILALLLAVGLAKSMAIILVIYFIVLFLAWRSQAPLSLFTKRVWLFVPLFTAFIALPALFITPGEPLVVLIKSPIHLAVTEQGLKGAVLLILRVGTSVSLVVLLILTTPWERMLRAISALGIPSSLVLILGMTHRYIFLLLHTARAMLLARRSRTVGTLSGSENRRFVAASLGNLMGKSYHLSQGVYLAMLSRGFRGHTELLEEFHLKPRDLLWNGALLLLALWMIYLSL